MAGNSLTRTEAADHLVPAVDGLRLFLLHAWGPGVQGLLFADIGDAGFPGDFEEFVQKLGAIVCGNSVSSELDVPDWQPGRLHPESNRVVFSLLFRLLEDLICGVQKLFVEIDRKRTRLNSSHVSESRIQ